jgi:hypothetical protein
MIGNTDELEKEIANVSGAGLDRVRADRWKDMELHFVRMQISGIPGVWDMQTDTILAIGPTTYWDAVRQNMQPNDWRLLDTIDTFRVEDRGARGYLPEFVRECKRQSADGWI